MNPNSVVVHHAGAGAHGAKSELARTFADFEFYTWIQSVTYTQSLWEQHAAMPIHLKSHVSSVSSVTPVVKTFAAGQFWLPE